MRGLASLGVPAMGFDDMGGPAPSGLEDNPSEGYAIHVDEIHLALGKLLPGTSFGLVKLIALSGVCCDSADGHLSAPIDRDSFALARDALVGCCLRTRIVWAW